MCVREWGVSYSAHCLGIGLVLNTGLVQTFASLECLPCLSVRFVCLVRTFTSSRPFILLEHSPRLNIRLTMTVILKHLPFLTQGPHGPARVIQACAFMWHRNYYWWQQHRDVVVVSPGYFMLPSMTRVEGEVKQQYTLTQKSPKVKLHKSQKEEPLNESCSPPFIGRKKERKKDT